jgi:hypothetical protein
LFGVGCKNGVEGVIHTIRLAVESAQKDPDVDAVILLIDFKCIQSCRQTGYVGGAESFCSVVRPVFPHSLWPVAKCPLHWFKRDHSKVNVDEGCIQGEVTGPLAISLLLKAMWLDYTAARQFPAFEDWENKSLISIIDDVTLICPADDAADFLLFCHLNGPGYGLHVSLPKSMVMIANAASRDKFMSRIREAQTLGVGAECINDENVHRLDQIAGFYALGAPFNCIDVDFTRRFVENKLSGVSASQLLDRVERNPDFQVRFRILQGSQGFPKCVFYVCAHLRRSEKLFALGKIVS